MALGRRAPAITVARLAGLIASAWGADKGRIAAVAALPVGFRQCKVLDSGTRLQQHGPDISAAGGFESYLDGLTANGPGTADRNFDLSALCRDGQAQQQYAYHHRNVF